MPDTDPFVDADSKALFRDILDAYMERPKSPHAVWVQLKRRYGYEDLKEEAVEHAMRHASFVVAVAVAEGDPEYCQKRVKRNLPKVLGTIERLADDANEDKRTRTSNAQWYAGVGGLSPSQKIEVGETTEAFLARMLKKPEPEPEA